MKNLVPPSLINYENQMQEFMQEQRKLCRVCYRRGCNGSCQAQSVSEEELAAAEKEMLGAIGRMSGGKEELGREIFRDALGEMQRRQERRRKQMFWVGIIGGALCVLAIIALLVWSRP